MQDKNTTGVMTWSVDYATRDIVTSADFKLVYQGVCMVLKADSEMKPETAFKHVQEAEASFSPLKGEVIN
jgi:hypothetical protein